MYRTLMCLYMMYTGCMYVNSGGGDDDDDDDDLKFDFHIFQAKQTTRGFDSSTAQATSCGSLGSLPLWRFD